MRRYPNLSLVDAMEAEGQEELLAANGASLPVVGSDHPAVAKFGIAFGASLDGVLREAKLPPGWKLRASPEYFMWNKLLDAKGRVRAEVFYSAVSYAREAEIKPCPRYEARMECQGQFGVVGESWRGYVLDTATGEEVFSTKTLRRETREDRRFIESDGLKLETAQWLSTHYPEHQDPAAYW